MRLRCIKCVVAVLNYSTMGHLDAYVGNITLSGNGVTLKKKKFRTVRSFAEQKQNCKGYFEESRTCQLSSRFYSSVVCAADAV